MTSISSTHVLHTVAFQMLQSILNTLSTVFKGHNSYWSLLMIIYWMNIYILWKKTCRHLISYWYKGWSRNFTEKTKYIFMSGEENARYNHHIKTANKSMEKCHSCRISGYHTDRYSYIHEDIKSRRNSGSAW
jgi:hypothetical protein